MVLTVAVLLWVGGFDVLYACQDFEHDRKVGLNSVPQAFGMEAAFWIARAMHVGMLVLLVWLIVLFGLGKLAMLGVGGGGAAAVRAHDRFAARHAADERGFLYAEWRDSVVFFAFVAADVLSRR